MRLTREEEWWVMGDNQNSRQTTNKIPAVTTIGPTRIQFMGTDGVGHRQAGTEVVCIGKERGKFGDSVVEGGNGREDGEEVSAIAAIAR